MKMNTRKGFTLIELLVVVAIIGILASIVLASLNSANSKGKDAGTKSNLKNAAIQAEIVYNTRTSNKETFSNVCNNAIVDGVQGIGLFINTAAKASGVVSAVSPGVYYYIGATGSGTTATCNNNAAAWAAEVPLSGSIDTSPKMWCVDSTGKSKQKNTNLADASDFACD